jgi:hypothetical protein
MDVQVDATPNLLCIDPALLACVCIPGEDRCAPIAVSGGIADSPIH